MYDLLPGISFAPTAPMGFPQLSTTLTLKVSKVMAAALKVGTMPFRLAFFSLATTKAEPTRDA